MARRWTSASDASPSYNQHYTTSCIHWEANCWEVMGAPSWKSLRSFYLAQSRSLPNRTTGHLLSYGTSKEWGGGWFQACHEHDPRHGARACGLLWTVTGVQERFCCASCHGKAGASDCSHASVSILRSNTPQTGHREHDRQLLKKGRIFSDSVICGKRIVFTMWKTRINQSMTKRCLFNKDKYDINRSETKNCSIPA